MWRQTAAAGLLAAASIVLSGCTTCHHRAADWSLRPVPCPDACSAQRSRVHLFLVGGLDVFDDGGLRGLRDAVNAAGFSQVYCGNTHHCGGFGREMRRIACDDPAARFVLFGYGLGVGSAIELAADACCEGRHIDGLVLLDPPGHAMDAVETLGVPVHVFGSDRWAPWLDVTACEVTKLPGVSHFAVATDPLTVEQTIGLLKSSVARVPDDAEKELALPMIDDPAPIPAVIPDRSVKKVVSPMPVSRAR